MKKLHLAAILLLTLLATTSWASEILRPGRTIIISDRIDSNMNQVIATLEDMTSDKSRRHINIILDSPGGSVSSGMALIQTMDRVREQRGIKIYCYVNRLAASMAMHILGSCDRRYAFPYTFLLWHEIRINAGFGAVLTETGLVTLWRQLRLLSTLLEPRLMEALGLTPEVFYYHNAVETLWPAAKLAELSPGFLEIIRGLKWSNGKSINLATPTGARLVVHRSEVGDIIEDLISSKLGTLGR